MEQKNKNWSVPFMVSRDATSSRLSVQKVAVAVRHKHTHGGVWLNIPRRQEQWSFQDGLECFPVVPPPGNSEYVQAELVGLACLAHNRSPPVHRYLLTRFGNEWLFELHFRVTNWNVGRTFQFVTSMNKLFSTAALGQAPSLCVHLCTRRLLLPSV